MPAPRREGWGLSREGVSACLEPSRSASTGINQVDSLSIRQRCALKSIRMKCSTLQPTRSPR
jgi:hypothetical protein